MIQISIRLKIVKYLVILIILFNNLSISHEFTLQKRDYSINSKSICVANLKRYERITCNSDNKIDILNAGLYNNTIPINNGTELARCMPLNPTTPLIKTVSRAFKLKCSAYSCLITTKTITDLVDNPLIDIMDLALDINYSCRTSGSVNTINSHPATYSFTYFFYIITLILSTSCILVGAVFILRKFLVMRRRNHYMAQRARHANRGYVPNSHSEDNNGDGNGGIWTTAYPPPSYDNIYENSVPINPLPDYNSTLTNQTKETKNGEMKTEPILADQNVEIPTDSYNVAYTNRDEIVTIVNPGFNPNENEPNHSNVTTSNNNNSNDNTDNINTVSDPISVENLQIVKQDGPLGNKSEELINERIGNQKV